MPPIGLPDWLYPGIVVQPIAWGNEVRTEFSPETRIQAWVTAIVVDHSSLYVHFRDFRYSPEANRFSVSGPTRTMPASEFVQVYQPRPSAYSSYNYVLSATQEPGSLGPGAFVAQRLPLADRPSEQVSVREIMDHVGGEVLLQGVDEPVLFVRIDTEDPSTHTIRLRQGNIVSSFSLGLFRLYFRGWGNNPPLRRVTLEEVRAHTGGAALLGDTPPTTIVGVKGKRILLQVRDGVEAVSLEWFQDFFRGWVGGAPAVEGEVRSRFDRDWPI